MVKIKNRNIVNFSKPYIIAEIGANHNGDMNLAKKIIDSAIHAGVDAVKFQSWSNKSLISEEEYELNQIYNDSEKKHFGSLREMVNKYFLRPSQHKLLKDYCDRKGITFCSTPFSTEEVDMLEDLNVDFYKIASMDINNFSLLKHVAEKQKTIILSTGMSSISEIENAVSLIESSGNNQIIILHCISIYPPKMGDVNLNNIKMLQKVFPKYPIGFSDHSLGSALPIAAASLGASLLEKHFTLDKNLPGWDHDISADFEEMKFIVDATNDVTAALGTYQRIVSHEEKVKKLKFRRSIVTTRKILKGEIISEMDITFKRPGTHISPDEKKYVIGRKTNRELKKDILISWEDLK